MKDSWRNHAACANWPLRFFFKDERKVTEAKDNYEDSVSIANITDQVCLTCPVIKQCLDDGTSNSDWGVRGGVFLSAGKIDKARNSHKTKEYWEKWRERVQS